MVKDIRPITFDNGQSHLYFTDVSANIQTETVTFKALNNTEKIRVFEQNFQKNLVNKQQILKKYIEKQIQVYVVFGDISRKIKGKLLGYNDGYILKTATGVNVFGEVAGIEFPELPQGFFTTPTLNWKVFSNGTHNTDCEVAYRTTGFSWKADYSITLNSNQTKADIGGWVTIDNNSGKKYQNATLKLIAGDVKTVNSNNNNYQPGMLYSKSLDLADSAPSFSQKSFSDYHLYTLSDPVTLTQSSQKQVQFIPKVYNVTMRKYNQISISAGGYTSQNIKATNKIHFTNTKKVGLGIALPKGVIRVFKEDQSDKSLEFIGQDTIDHTPKDQNVTISIGNSFDITVKLYANNRRTYDQGGYSVDMNLTVSNHKDTNTQIEVVFHNYYSDNLQFQWKTTNVSLQKKTSSQYRWKKQYKPNQSFVYQWKQTYNP